MGRVSECPICKTKKCGVHDGIIIELKQVEKELSRTNEAKCENMHKLRALSLYNDLSDEARADICVLIAIMLSNLRYIAAEDGKPTHLGSLGALELICSLVKGGYL